MLIAMLLPYLSMINPNLGPSLNLVICELDVFLFESGFVAIPRFSSSFGSQLHVRLKVELDSREIKFFIITINLQ